MNYVIERKKLQEMKKMFCSQEVINKQKAIVKALLPTFSNYDEI